MPTSIARGGPWARRAGPGRGSTAGWRAWVRAVGAYLRDWGQDKVATRLETCGRTCESRSCLSCGERHAAVTILTSCDVRACPLCAKRAAAAETLRVSGAVDRVPAASQSRSWSGRTAPNAREKAMLGTRASWRWKLVTISPAWHPDDPAEYEPRALRHRLGLVREAWSRLWKSWFRVGGLGGAYSRVELSDRGHVHLHALVYGPWVRQTALLDTVGAGFMIDVRAADDGAASEVAKYCLKSPVPGADWIAGNRKNCAHPKLAAAWVVASKGARLADSYGVFRDCLAAADVCGSADTLPVPPACAVCLSPNLSSPHPYLTRDVAPLLALRSQRFALGRLPWDDG